MKILHTVEFYEPSHGGMQEVVKQISERLVQKGHSVTVATSTHPARMFSTLNGVTIKEFDISGNLVNGYRGDTSAYQQFLLNSDFDVIVNFAAQQWATDLMLPLLPRIKAKKVSVPTGFSGLQSPRYHRYFEDMKTWMQQYDVNVFHSTTYQDILFARENGIANIAVIPNASSREEFEEIHDIDIKKILSIPKNHFLVILVGSHDGRKGHAEAIEIFRRAQIKNATLVITGSVFSQRCYWACKCKEFLFRFNNGSKSLIVTSLPRPQIVELYKAADLFMFPTTWECSPLVLFEAMAAKTPFLVTDAGNSPEIIEWTHGGLLLPTQKDKNGFSHPEIQSSAELLQKVANDTNMRTEMQESGYRAWRDRFTWENIAEQYEHLYLTLCGSLGIP